MRQDANFEVTIEQIGRLERALLAMRQSSTAPPDTLDTIAAIQYQEIVRLRSELDAALGFGKEDSSLERPDNAPTPNLVNRQPA